METKLTPRFMLQLAAPHTWPASVMPVMMSVCAATSLGYEVHALTASILLAICVLMQSAVNTFNDYFDFVKGADSKEDDVDSSDSVLIYNDIKPRKALMLAIGFLVCAFLLGIYVVVISGVIPLVIALIGALIVVIYSGGKTPISYLPIGEIVSGVVMGGLIPFACFFVLTGCLEPLVVLWAAPMMIGIGLIMMTNNTCDIEKDVAVGRRTLSVRIGRESARRLYHALLSIMVVSIVAIIAAFFTEGWILLIFMIVAAYPFILALWKNPLSDRTRQAAMSQICSVNVVLGAFYCAAMLF